MKKTLINEIGNVYSKLTVIARDESKPDGSAKWICQCECGCKTSTVGNSLRSGRTRSCGCECGNPRSGNAAIKRVYRGILNGARNRGLEVLVSIEDFRVIGIANCYYCGSKPEKKYAYHSTRYRQGIESDEYIEINGLDRVDNTKGYEIGNVVSCCFMCNSMKSNYTKEGFLSKITQIHNHLYGKETSLRKED